MTRAVDRFIAYVAAVVFLAALTVILIVEHGRASIKPYVINDDAGGFISSYLDHYRALRDSHVKVEIRGDCVSACTLVMHYIPRSRACVGPEAHFGFHMARRVLDGGAVPDPEMTKELIELYYPKPVQDWLKDKTLTVEHILYMDAAEIVRLGVYPYCEGT